jgi:thymidylate synthase ThyX
VGDRTLVRTPQVSNLRLRLLDSKGAARSKLKAVFESRAVYEGDIEDLPRLVPRLVRAALDGFPGKSSMVRTVKLDEKTGAVLARSSCAEVFTVHG